MTTPGLAAGFVILIPCYEPDRKLNALVRSIRSNGCTAPIVVVNDGSGPQYDPMFSSVADLGCDVIAHHPNRGKGYALRVGFGHVETTYSGAAVVCADCDGQHAVPDILRVVAEVRDDTIVLGSRRFGGSVPFKSRFGNSMTRLAFRLTTGRRLHDTQTGLRAIPASLLPWLKTIPGDRYEYELQMLLLAAPAGVELVEIPIETIYVDANASTHFRPLADSARVWAPLARVATERVRRHLPAPRR